MKKVYIVGIGIGSKEYLHKRAKKAIEKSELLLGAERMLKDFSDLNKEVFISYDYLSIYEHIKKTSCENYGVLVSGDTGFYSMSKNLTKLLLDDSEIELENIPSISSLQYFTSKLNLPWDNIKHISAHGRETNIVSHIAYNERLFILTDKNMHAGKICKMLCEEGLGELKVSLGENLSYSNERIIEGQAKDFAEEIFTGLTVMLIHNDNPINSFYHSIPDDEFIRGKSPMTKSEVRTISVGKLKLKENYTVYDIGAGTGSVSIEAALKLKTGKLYSIEKDEDACKLIVENIKKFNAFNIEVIKGSAPETIINLPAPDACFIGGAGGNLDTIISAILSKNPCVKVVINVISLESLNEAVTNMEKYNFTDVEIINVSVSKAKKVGNYHMLMAQNPIYIISGRGVL